MTPAEHQTFLEELDARQSEVLGQLDDLNARIEQLLKECATTREETIKKD